MGLDLSVRKLTWGGSDMSWIKSEEGTRSNLSATLDLALFNFAATFTSKKIPSGVVLGKVTSSGKYGPYGANANEVQTINLGAASAGTVTITFDGETSGSIAYNASNATILAALEAMSNIQPGDVTVTGGPWPGTNVSLTFTGADRGGKNQPQITASGLTGGTVTIATATAGGSAVSDGRETARGHLFTDVDVTNLLLAQGTTSLTGDVIVPLYIRGVVLEAKLPTNHGLDAAAKTQLPFIQYL
jgi:hypothetical protein